MNNYTIYCTPEQTEKAFELGASIRNFITKEESKKLVDTAKSENRIEEYENELIKYHNTIIGNMVYCIPTAEQMIGWLEDQGLLFQTTKIGALVLKENNAVLKICKCSRKEATLAAIDAALEYLSNDKK